jgi:hypothetical protein
MLFDEKMSTDERLRPTTILGIMGLEDEEDVSQFSVSFRFKISLLLTKFFFLIVIAQDGDEKEMDSRDPRVIIDEFLLVGPNFPQN